MGRKNREYKKGNPFRDCAKYIIVAEGQREDSYFLQFKKLSSRLEIDIVEREEGRSAVNHFIKRINIYKEKYDFQDEDHIWFVFDVDKWERDEITNLEIECKKENYWNCAISNPCFEVWLYYHFKDKIPEEINTNKKMKAGVSKLTHGGYNPRTFASRVQEAVINSSKADTNSSKIYPEKNQTKVYILAKNLIKLIGVNNLQQLNF